MRRFPSCLFVHGKERAAEEQQAPEGTPAEQHSGVHSPAGRSAHAMSGCQGVRVPGCQGVLVLVVHFCISEWRVAALLKVCFETHSWEGGFQNKTQT